MSNETSNNTGVAILKAESTGTALTPGQLVWRRFIKHKMALIGAVAAILLILFIIIGSILVPIEKANYVDLAANLQPPSATHWFGTDSTGRDSFNRIIYGGQISIIVGILAVFVEVSLGVIIGGLAGYFGGWVDALLMRFTEAMLSIPALFLLIVLSKYLSRDIQTINLFGLSFSGSVAIVILVIGLTSWMYLARIIRANVLSLKETDYVSASRSLGASNVRIFFNHLVPNTLGPIIVATTLGLAAAILYEAYVSFLGLGVQPPTASWGNMLTSAQSFIQRGAWWMWLFPSLFIVFIILAINLMGDGLRDAFDPHSTRHM
jgi:peptide/nickel transport system permease protein